MVFAQPVGDAVEFDLVGTEFASCARRCCARALSLSISVFDASVISATWRMRGTGRGEERAGLARVTWLCSG
jgi:hypothetical protein